MDELELQKQRKEIMRTEQIEKLKTLQTWGPAQGEALQQQKQTFETDVMELQTQYDEAVIANMQAQLPHAQVNAAAAVPHPPVQQNAAKEGYKARREREKKRKAAQKICSVGDEYTIDMASGILEGIQCRDLVLTDELKQACEQSHTDMRAQNVFCHDFKLDKKGQPATDEDEAILQQNRQFISDYATGDATLRKPHLERITKEMSDISFSLTPDMFAPEHLTKNAAKYKHMGDMFTYFENIQKENPAFFAALPQLQKDLISQQNAAGVAFTGAFAQHMNARGINFNYGTVYNKDMIPVIEMGRDFIGMATQQYTDTLKQTNINRDEAYSHEVERQTEINKAELLLTYAEQDQQLKAEYGVSFPAGASELQYSDMQKYRNMIADHPEEYAANKDLIDTIFSDYYKTLSKMGEKSLPLRARQMVIDDNNEPMSADHIKRNMVRVADSQNTDDLKEINLLSHYGNNLMDIMEHVLRGKPLLDGPAKVLSHYRTPAPNNSGDGSEV